MREARVNNIDLGRIANSRDEFKKNGGHHYIEKRIEGEYRLDGSPAFYAEVKTDNTKFTLNADEPVVLGGLGVHVSPLTYVLYGTMACFASTVAIMCAEKGLRLGHLRITGVLNYDIGPMLTDTESPLIKDIHLEVDADKDIRSIVAFAKERCPAVYLFSNQIKTQTVQKEKPTLVARSSIRAAGPLRR